MPLFSPNRSLLNPKFEGYKLDPISQEDAVVRHELPYKITQSTVSTSRSPISMQEVQSRITHNHLAMAGQGNRALYVDAEFRVILIDIDEVSHLIHAQCGLVSDTSHKVDDVVAFISYIVRAAQADPYSWHCDETPRIPFGGDGPQYCVCSRRTWMSIRS